MTTGNEILERRIRLLALKFRNLPLLDDLIQVGRVALWQSEKTWRPDMGASLWTYARKRVWGAMADLAKQNASRGELDIDDERAEHVSDPLNIESPHAVEELLGLLTDEQFAVIRGVVEGRTFEAIGADLHCSDSRVRRIFASASEVIRKRANVG